MVPSDCRRDEPEAVPAAVPVAVPVPTEGWWRTCLLAGALAFAVGGCGPAMDKPPGPADSYLLFTQSSPLPTGLPLVRLVGVSDSVAQPFSRMFADGFASEMLRTVYLAKQFVRNAVVDGRHFADQSRSLANEPTVFLLGAAQDSLGRGLAFPRWMGDPVQWPNTPWLSFTDAVATDKAAVQTVAGRLASVAAGLVTTGGALNDRPMSSVLSDAYRMAMEVIAREWRSGSGPQGAVSFDAGTAAQKALFADIRENRLVLDAPGGHVRPARDLLADPRVAATVIYRWAQARGVGPKVAPDAFYQPFTLGKPPAGVTPAALLGSFRNFQAKFLGTWGTAVLRDHPPPTIADFLTDYGAQFPGERAEAVRIFVVTTYAATVKPGGVSTRSGDATAAVLEMTTLVADVLAGRRSLTDAVTP